MVHLPYTWKIAESDYGSCRALSEAAGVPPLVAHLLRQRGVSSPEEAEAFLNPGLAQLSDPYSLTDMDVAVARITQARDRGEQMFIFGDYDVDGLAATAILYRGLTRFGIERCQYTVPHRLNEGYGLGPAQVEAAQQEGASLIVTVDNGISAHGAAAKARELGVDLIVTDHHSIEGSLPDAFAVVNPKREGAEHPLASLCGAGVAFKLCCALNGSANDLDFAALGTVADIVPLLGENRAIVSLGLKHMIKHQRLGLAKLAAESSIRIEEVTAEKIMFQLAPRINANGRLEDGLSSLQLLLSESAPEAEHMARELNRANQERRAIENEIFESAVEELETLFRPGQRGIVLARRNWHSGVIGIVASRIEGRYHRPVVLISIDEDGCGRGSARGGDSFNLIEAISPCQQYLEEFGGHRGAAGLSILEGNIDAFRAAFEAEALRQLGPGEISPSLGVDAIASFSEIDSHLLRSLERLEPMGHGNPQPVLCSMGVELVPKSTRVLKDRHLKLSFRQNDRVFAAIGFGMAERFYTETMPRVLDIAYTPQFNTWRGETSIQLVLKDLRPA